MQELGFQFANLPTRFDELFQVGRAFLLQLVDEVILGPVGDLQIHHFLFQCFEPRRVWPIRFVILIFRFRGLWKGHFRTFGHLGLFLLDCPLDALLRQVIFPFVRFRSFGSK